MISSREVLVSGAPFIHDHRTTARSAWLVSFMLLPILLWETLLSGWGTLGAAAASISVALAADLLQSGLRRRFELDDGSAFLTGLLIALALPLKPPLYAPIAASAFAILVIKGAFGGLGNNWMNPALGGVAFAWLNWGPSLAASQGSTPASLPLAFVSTLPSLVSGFDDRVTGLLNTLLFQPLGASLPSGYVASMLGVESNGTIGLPVGLALAASAALIGFRVIRWQIPAAMFLFFIAPFWAFGGLASSGLFSGDVLGQTLAGSFLLVAFFMATDPVTSPSRTGQMIIFGAGCGLIAFLFVEFGAPAFAPLFGVLFMNALMPFIEGIRWPRAKLGEGKE
ncbi:MAG TPA: RnfABCDGE type electron transport complex subunit D [Rectinemataceae bacterium]|nr:RnfABCDGE type electron transport complex subunit D [Rectinemataceae bacterium]